MFDFTEAMEELAGHIAKSCPELSHVDPGRMVISYTRTRTPGAFGIYASVRPLRFKDGSETTVHRGRTYSIPRVVHKGREVLYIVNFALPRFLNLDFDTKLSTVFHELYHISPKFNGDIRRFKGKYYAHGHSRKRYNERAWELAQKYLSMPESEQYTQFLHMNFKELERKFGSVVGTKVRPPKPRLV
jgi:predicted metallopeptidase